MPLAAMLTCHSVESAGGGVWMPLCQARRRAESWPPTDARHLSESGTYGHDVTDCEECQAVAYAHPDVFCYETPERGAAPLEHSTVNEAGETVGRRVRYRMVLEPGKGRETVKLGAVKTGELDDPNNAWAAATPHGQLEMTIDNPDAWGFFEPGVDYKVTITRRLPQMARDR